MFKMLCKALCLPRLSRIFITVIFFVVCLIGHFIIAFTDSYTRYLNTILERSTDMRCLSVVAQTQDKVSEIESLNGINHVIACIDGNAQLYYTNGSVLNFTSQNSLSVSGYLVGSPPQIQPRVVFGNGITSKYDLLCPETIVASDGQKYSGHEFVGKKIRLEGIDNIFQIVGTYEAYQIGYSNCDLICDPNTVLELNENRIATSSSILVYADSYSNIESVYYDLTSMGYSPHVIFYLDVESSYFLIFFVSIILFIVIGALFGILFLLIRRYLRSQMSEIAMLKVTGIRNSSIGLSFYINIVILLLFSILSASIIFYFICSPIISWELFNNLVFFVPNNLSILLYIFGLFAIVMGVEILFLPLLFHLPLNISIKGE